MNSYINKDCIKVSKKQEQAENCKVYIGNLDHAWSEENMYQAMSKFGKIVHIDICKNNSGRSKGYGIVTYSNLEAAKSACGQINFREKVLEVRPSNRKRQSDLKSTNSKRNVKASNYQKENNFQMANSFAEDCLTQSSDLKILSANKLSKHSKQFITSEAVSTSGGSGSEVRDLTVKIINLSSSTEFLLSTPESGMSPIQAIQPTQRPKLISKLSKEFHPTIKIASLESPFNAICQPLPPVTPYLDYNPMLALCPLSPTASHPEQPAVDLHRPVNSTHSQFRIAFFTFPGRD